MSMMREKLKAAIKEAAPKQSDRVTRARMAIESVILRAGPHEHEISTLDKRELAKRIDDLIIARVEEILEP